MANNLSYYDKNNKKIDFDMIIQHENGQREKVCFIIGIVGDDELCIEATSSHYTNECGFVADDGKGYFFLSQLDLSKWEVIENQETIKLAREKLTRT